MNRKSPLPPGEWIRSSYSSGNGGQCVEVATAGSPVPVRDSKEVGGPVLLFGAFGWSRFVSALKHGELSA
ncbi:DUF397 domain-containing protein [Streptomyces sulphureus]|uniref:DUF397 domain-containing protein n=1 Tax=Streptomyces sulphureus TaxID=47758 RepID=UPI0009967509|nr:DUF397 domain-containing protein [Streptomyces sulphureus]